VQIEVVERRTSGSDSILYLVGDEQTQNFGVFFSLFFL